MRKSLEFIGRIVSAGLAGLLTFGNPGCTMPQPRYDAYGRYIGEEDVIDPGRTFAGLGAVMTFLPRVGPFGFLAQGLGNLASESQRRETEEERWLRMQAQVDALNQRNGSVQPQYPALLQPEFGSAHYGDRLGPSNALEVNQKDGREIPLQTRSLVPEAIDYSREEKSPIGIRLNSEVGVAPMKVSYFALLPSDLTEEHSCSWAINNVPVSTGHKGWTVLKEPGEYTVELDFVNAHGQEFVARRTVNVLKRITAGGQGN